MRRFAVLPLFALAGFLISGCGSSTRFTQVWKDESLTKWEFKKVAVAAINPNESIRRVAEDQMAASVRAHGLEARGISSIVAPDKLRDKDHVKSVLQADGYDAIITMRLVGRDEKTSYVPGTVYSVPVGHYSAWGYYGYGWTSVYEPGYLVQNTYVTIETNVYSLKDEKLVWSGTSESADPSSAQDLVKEISREAYYEMQKQGLVR